MINLAAIFLCVGCLVFKNEHNYHSCCTAARALQTSSNCCCGSGGLYVKSVTVTRLIPGVLIARYPGHKIIGCQQLPHSTFCACQTWPGTPCSTSLLTCEQAAIQHLWYFGPTVESVMAERAMTLPMLLSCDLAGRSVLLCQQDASPVYGGQSSQDKSGASRTARFAQDDVLNP